MNQEIFAQWIRNRGYHVIRSNSTYWYEAAPRVFQAFPFHWVIQPSEQELKEIILKHGILALRYSAPLDAPDGMISYHTVACGPYTLNGLSGKARTSVRRGINNFSIEPISFDCLAYEGWRLQQETLARQGRMNSMNQAEWERLCLAAKNQPGFEAWGAIHHGELAAAEMAVKIEDSYNLIFEQSLTKYLDKRVNNALVFSVCANLLARPGVKEVFLGLQSLDAPPSVDHFKFNLGIQPRPVRQRVVIHPLLKPFSQPLSLAALQKLQKALPGNTTLPKMAGMLHFYLQGRRDLTEQDWPRCLLKVKDEVIHHQMIHPNPQSEFSSPDPEKSTPRIFLDASAFDPNQAVKSDHAVLLLCFNEAKTIYERVCREKQDCTGVVVFDQGSQDDTPFIAAKAGAIVVLGNMNHTYEESMQRAMQSARLYAKKVIVKS